LEELIVASISTFSQQAQLSLAAYATLSPALDTTVLIERLRTAGMSSAQAAQFAATYVVVDQFTDPSSGFSATVFRKGTEYFFAVRGTESIFSDPADLIGADIPIALGGSPSKQMLALYNYYQRLITPTTENAIQYTYVLPGSMS
jgi:hypothetical protein